MVRKMKKTCTACNKKLPLSFFWKEKQGRHGVKSQCKKCHYKYRAKNRVYKDSRKYSEGDCIKINFCKKCGQLLGIRHPGKNVIRKFYKGEFTSVFHKNYCEKCYYIKQRKRREKSIRIQKRIECVRRMRRGWRLCPVCGQAVQNRDYLWEYFNIHYYPGCSKDCQEKIDYALSVRDTGINGVGVRLFGNIFQPIVGEDEWWLRVNTMYKMALLAKEYTIFKRARIDIKKTLKEIKNGSIRTGNQRTQTDERPVDIRHDQAVRSERQDCNLQPN